MGYVGFRVGLAFGILRFFLLIGFMRTLYTNNFKGFQGPTKTCFWLARNEPMNPLCGPHYSLGRSLDLRPVRNPLGFPYTPILGT